MNHLRWKGTLGLLALAVVMNTGQTLGADEKKDDNNNKNNSHFQACAKECAECMRECESCTRHCADLIVEGQKDHLITMGTCIDCADVCAAAAKIVARRGPMSAAVCESCAKACDTCGAACEKFSDDEQMKRSAQECRNCAKVCREMLNHTSASK